MTRSERRVKKRPPIVVLSAHVLLAAVFMNLLDNDSINCGHFQLKTVVQIDIRTEEPK